MNKSTTYLVIGAVVLAVAAGGAWFLSQGPAEQNQEEVLQQEEQQEEENMGGLIATAVVLYTDTGFVPQNFVIKAGEAVTFVNGSTNPMWPATAVHPTHQVYPGSDIKKCQTADKQKIFDACKEIQPGNEWSFTFSEKGSWGYHDHVNLNMRGTIVVE